MKQWIIDAILTGSVDIFGPGERRSAIRKAQGNGPFQVTALGVEGDEHGDLEHHGGVDRAIHHYAFDNYAFWRTQYPDRADRFASPGAFGENLTSQGFDESDICVGDLYRLGSATLQVSQARQPCWKLARRSEIPGFALRVQEAARTGWFYRVIRPGRISAGDELVLLERPHPTWSLMRLLTVMYRHPLDHRELEEMASLQELTESWREIARRRLATGRVESWKSRVTIPEE